MKLVVILIIALCVLGAIKSFGSEKKSEKSAEEELMSSLAGVRKMGETEPDKSEWLVEEESGEKGFFERMYDGKAKSKYRMRQIASEERERVTKRAVEEFKRDSREEQKRINDSESDNK